MAKFQPVDEQLELIREGAVDILPEDELAAQLERSKEAGTGLVVKEGFDPTRPDLHLGHAVSIQKLKTFQDLPVGRGTRVAQRAGASRNCFAVTGTSDRSPSRMR